MYFVNVSLAYNASFWFQNPCVINLLTIPFITFNLVHLLGGLSSIIAVNSPFAYGEFVAKYFSSKHIKMITLDRALYFT